MSNIFMGARKHITLSGIYGSNCLSLKKALPFTLISGEDSFNFDKCNFPSICVFR